AAAARRGDPPPAPPGARAGRGPGRPAAGRRQRQRPRPRRSRPGGAADMTRVEASVVVEWSLACNNRALHCDPPRPPAFAAGGGETARSLVLCRLAAARRRPDPPLDQDRLLDVIEAGDAAAVSALLTAAVHF